MSSFESLLLTQTERQLSALQDQSHYYSEWFKFERKFIDKIICEETFFGQISNNWEAATLFSSSKSSEIQGKWGSASSLCLQEGLYVTNRIVRCKEQITLKALAVEIKFETRIAMNSEIWVITRGSGVKDPYSAIVKISKESDIDGIFIVFGSPIGNDNEFVFFKRQQIPEESFDPNDEFNEIEIRVRDNGDDRIDVNVKTGVMKKNCFQTFCNKFVPTLVDHRVMIAGHGRNAIVKNLSVQQKERSRIGIIVEASKRQQCCSVF